jgi:hypothetical protein
MQEFGGLFCDGCHNRPYRPVSVDSILIPALIYIEAVVSSERTSRRSFPETDGTKFRARFLSSPAWLGEMPSFLPISMRVICD